MDKREQAAIAYTGVQGRMKNEPAAYKRMCFRDGWDAAIAAIEPAPVSVQNWEGFARDLLESWPVRDIDGAELFDAALRNGLIAEVPGGYDPEQHIDADGICPETGDPWYEYTFRALAEKGEA